MIDLASARAPHGPVALAAISQRQQISLSYLEQLFGKLRRARAGRKHPRPGRRLLAGPQGRGDHCRRHHRRGRRADRRHRVRRQGKLHGRRHRPLHDARPVGQPERQDDRVPRLRSRLRKLVDDQLAKGVSIEEQPVKRAISSQPVVKPIKVNGAELGVRLGQRAFEVSSGLFGLASEPKRLQPAPWT